MAGSISGTGPGTAMTTMKLASQPRIGLTPFILKDDILQRPAPELAEAPHRPADRQDRVGLDAGREAQDRIDPLPIAGMPRRQRRAEAERADREQHVLDRRIDRRPRGAPRVLAG